MYTCVLLDFAVVVVVVVVFTISVLCPASNTYARVVRAQLYVNHVKHM